MYTNRRNDSKKTRVIDYLKEKKPEIVCLTEIKL